jgi:hypothetical protein
MDPVLSRPSPVFKERPPAPEQSPILQEALQLMGGDPPTSIPLIVWLLENPASPIALPGQIDLHRHDCLHLLLNRGFSLYDEAFVVGFTMGNDVRTRGVHCALFKFCSFLFYPKTYRFHRAHLKVFDLGWAYGRAVKVKNLNQMNFSSHTDQPLDVLRDRLGIERKALQILRQAEEILTASAVTFS